MASKGRVINAFNNQPSDHILVCFWFHLVDRSAFNGGEKVISTNIAGHKKYIHQIHPDFVKIMSDGFHHHPAIFSGVKTVDDLKKIKNLDKNNKWITSQVEIAKSVVEIDKNLSFFYNIFSPATHLRYVVGGADNLVNFLNENPTAVTDCLHVIAQDLAVLCTEVLTHSGVDGIYYSVSNPNNDRLNDSTYKSYIEPSDLYVLNVINGIKDFNILHVCGHGGRKNSLPTFAHYHSKAVNWGWHENVNLAEGKKIFGGRCVIGGFSNSNAPNTLLHDGKKEDIEAEVEKIVKEAGRVGVVIGADCALHFGVDVERLKWVRDKAYSL